MIRNIKVKDGEEDICDVTFGDSRTQCSVKVYFAERFNDLRLVIVGIVGYMRTYTFYKQNGEPSQKRLADDQSRDDQSPVVSPEQHCR
ncbi:hypothetical protein Ddc_15917 [Ditylenchus destructor]|nr:hypothetical protein Ddc_15917 [Ditylenchus destructor]